MRRLVLAISLFAVACAMVPTASFASDHADPIFNSEPDAGLTGLFVFPVGGGSADDEAGGTHTASETVAGNDAGEDAGAEGAATGGETAEHTTQPGVAVGLAYTSHGGDILFIEAMTTMEQLAANIASADLELDRGVLKRIEEIHRSQPNPFP